MKRTKSKINLDQLHQDLEQLSNKEFEKRYPGVKKAQLQGLSDDKLAEIAGGFNFNLGASFGAVDNTGSGSVVKSTGPLVFRG